jgi:hypothetical protein
MTGSLTAARQKAPGGKLCGLRHKKNFKTQLSPCLRDIKNESFYGVFMSKIFSFSNNFPSFSGPFTSLPILGSSDFNAPLQNQASFVNDPQAGAQSIAQLLDFFESLITQAEKLVDQLLKSKAPPALDKTSPNNGAGASGSNEFLWKPHSDKNGNLVILLPSSLSGNISGVRVLSPNGKSVLAVGKNAGSGNGDRMHFRFNRSGDSFPSGAVVEITLKNGTLKQQVIKNTGARFTHNGL